jgi:hypothetical protein
LAPTRRFHRHRLERDGKILHHRIGDVFHQHTLLIERAPLDGVDIAQLSQLRVIFGDFWGVEQAKGESNQAPLISERL